MSTAGSNKILTLDCRTRIQCGCSQQSSIFGIKLHIPYVPCMVYLPTCGWFLGHMLVCNIPAPWSIWVCYGRCSVANVWFFLLFAHPVYFGYTATLPFAITSCYILIATNEKQKVQLCQNTLDASATYLICWEITSGIKSQFSWNGYHLFCRSTIDQDSTTTEPTEIYIQKTSIEHQWK